jgi:hypothetical protein
MVLTQYFTRMANSLEDAYSWLDPRGVFHPVPAILSHEGWSRQHKDSSVYDLYEENWMRILYMGEVLYANNASGVFLNERQKQALVDLALSSHRFTEIVFDNDVDDRVIWSSEDRI